MNHQIWQIHQYINRRTTCKLIPNNITSRNKRKGILQTPECLQFHINTYVDALFIGVKVDKDKLHHLIYLVYIFVAWKICWLQVPSGSYLIRPSLTGEDRTSPIKNSDLCLKRPCPWIQPVSRLFVLHCSQRMQEQCMEHVLLALLSLLKLKIKFFLSLIYIKYHIFICNEVILGVLRPWIQSK